MAIFTDDQIMRMPIGDVVRPENGGTGLASAAFQIPLTFLNIFGWENIDSEVETLVVEGKNISRTRLRGEVMRLLGRKTFMRRVLLKPAPLDIMVQALTKGTPQFSVAVTVTVQYRLEDAARVASEMLPLRTFESIVQGILVQYIRQYSQDELLTTPHNLQMPLEVAIRSDSTLALLFNEIRILKLIARGDERVIEVHRATAEATAQIGLTLQQNESKAISARYDIKIDEERAKLNQQKADAQHQRDMEILQHNSQAQLQQTLLNAIAATASAGGNVEAIVRAAAGLLPGSTPATPLAALGRGTSDLTLPISSAVPDAVDRIALERAALTDGQTSLGYIGFDILQAGDTLTGAILTFPSYRLMIQCLPDYPSSAPLGTARYLDESQRALDVIWMPTPHTLLVHYVMAAIPLANQAVPPPGAPSRAQSHDVFEDDAH